MKRLRLPAIRYPGFLRNRSLRLGLYASGFVALLLIGSTAFSQARLGDKTIHAEFAQAAGLRPGATVDISGIEVGSVTAVTLDNGKVLVDLKVHRDVHLAADAKAAIKMSTILGRLHVDLVPGKGTALSGDRIRLENTSVPYNLGKVIQDPQYKSSFEHIERIDPQKLRQALDVVDQQMGSSPNWRYRRSTASVRWPRSSMIAGTRWTACSRAWTRCHSWRPTIRTACCCY